MFSLSPVGVEDSTAISRGEARAHRVDVERGRCGRMCVWSASLACRPVFGADADRRSLV